MGRNKDNTVNFNVSTSSYLEDSDANRFPKSELEELAKSKLVASLKPLGQVPANVSCSISSEGSETDRVQKVSVQVTVGKKRQIISAAHARSVEKALMRAAADVSAQARKAKTRAISRSRRQSTKAKYTKAGSNQTLV